MLIAIPLLLIPVVLYNIVVLFGGSSTGGMAEADAILRDPLFSIPMTSGALWNVGSGDLILLLGGLFHNVVNDVLEITPCR